MKRILLLLLTVLTFSAAQSQAYNNEWIDYNKTYYKFKVRYNNLIRIYQPTLAAIGLGNVNADHFQIWRNGKEVILHTSVQNAVMGAGDFIEFWGEMNDGKPDNPLYREPDYQLNDKYSLQADTAVYFLTVNTSSPNARFVGTPNNVAGNTLAPEPFFMYTAGNYFRDRINPGRAELVGDSYTYSSSYDYGEGWTSSDIPNGNSLNFNLGPLFPYTGPGAPTPTFKINAVGNAVHPRSFRVKLNGDSILGRVMDYYDYVKASTTFDIAKLSGGNAAIEIANLSTSANDRMAVAQSELVYPRQFNFGGANIFPFELPANASASYLEITGFNYYSPIPVLYDFTNRKRYLGDISTNGVVKIVLEPSALDRKLVMVSQVPSFITDINAAEFSTRNFVNYGLAANQGNYLIITHPSLTAASGPGDPVEEYRAYRSSAVGGGYTARTYLIDQLVDQFGLGIKQNPLAIRNFVRWARANYSTPLKDVLIIGKGVVYNLFRTYDGHPGMTELDLVPTFGNPASDNLLTAVGNSSVPLTPIGRLSVISKDEITVYLNKLKQYEQALKISSPLVSEKGWMKNVVHVVGAGDNNTSNLLTAALNGHKAIIEDTLYAGNVHTFTKSSADAVQQVSSTRLSNLFSEGIGILTYFGHSSSSTLEFNLDNPAGYNNPGKYPVFVVMGCNAGSFFGYNLARFTIKETLSEKYLLANERGSIAFLASTHLGIIHYLDIYNAKQYNVMSRTNYGGTLGEIMDETIRQVFGLTTESDFYARFHCEQFTLHGDPALRLYNFDKPDYAIEDQMVNISPKFIPVSEPNFKVKAGFVNLGRAPNKKIVIELKRTFPDLRTEIIKRDTIAFTHYSDSISYVIPIDASRDKGLNKITVTVDADNNVDELYETNNSITKDVYIIEDDVRPVYPYNYSIINQQNIKLVASSANPFATLRQYQMEIDTTQSFNSSLKVSKTVSSTGGTFEFDPGISFADSTVYYWRVAPTVATGLPLWNNSSFQYINNGHPGFSQAHYFQHLNSDHDHINLGETREWRFDSITNNLFVRNGVWGTGITVEGQLTVNVNDSSYIRSACSFGLIFNVFDQKTFIPWKNKVVGGAGLYGSVNPGCAPSRIWNFEFPNTQAGRNAALQFLRSIPDGNFVVFRFLMLNGAATQFAPVWLNDELTYGAGNSMYTELKNQGLTDIDSLNRTRALSFVYKKNRMLEHAPRFIFSDGNMDPISLSVDCITPTSTATVTSPKVGPAKNWKELHWNGNTIDPSIGDKATVDIYGVTNDGTESIMFSGLTTADQDYDISSIDAAQYPYVVMKLHNTDTVHYTPYQLRYWMLTYDPVPEGAVSPNIYFTTKDTVEVGEPFNFGIAFKNISNLAFDSVKVKMSITDKHNVENIIPIPRQKPLAVSDTIKINVPIATGSLSGHNTIFVNFNPDNDQPEQHLFNNYVFRSLYVKPDSLNPLLDVTFDGVHILNRDIVAAKPAIVVELKDEAKWLLLDDTSLLSVQVRYPDGSLRRFYFNNDTLQFIPAAQSTGNGNVAKLNFKPYFPQDGDYDLIVSGQDKSGNLAGAIQYKVGFQVINKPMISNILNYPNPFTTSTAFVFTITGSEVPQNIRIQVLTITGKIVREITKNELGPLHVGRNITEFKWDGTDQYGQKLANGIYLYRVITNQNGKALDKYKAEGDNTDKYFNKGYGKMYLMR